MPKPSRIPASVSRDLGHYVYLYINPLTDKVFYVGKGVSRRALAHLKPGASVDVRRELRAIRAAGEQPRIEVLAHNLGTARAALAVEAAAISLLGLDNLANAVRGHNSRLSRFTVDDLVAHYTTRQVSIKEPALLIRVNQLFRPGMSDGELYDITRSAWILGEQRKRVELVMPVFEGVIREVYRPTAWLEAVSTFNYRFKGRRHSRRGRQEFVGVIAEEKVRRRYRGAFIGDRFPPGSQNPIKYVNLE